LSGVGTQITTASVAPRHDTSVVNDTPAAIARATWLSLMSSMWDRPADNAATLPASESRPKHREPSLDPVSLPPHEWHRTTGIAASFDIRWSVAVLLVRARMVRGGDKG